MPSVLIYLEFQTPVLPYRKFQNGTLFHPERLGHQIFKRPDQLPAELLFALIIAWYGPNVCCCAENVSG